MRVLKYENLNGWRPIPIPELPIKATLCPACKVPIYVIAVISGKVRVGCCDYCGYMGYMDRPSKEWFEEFYKTQWDAKGQQETPAITQITQPSSMLDYLLLRTNTKKDKPLLEIGCGFGFTLSFLKHLGHQVLCGVEKSKHRAAVSEKRGFEIYRGSFEDIDFKDRKFSTIIHHHVLEHVEDPDAFIAKCASMQIPGDIMALCMPNNLGEPTAGVLFYLPHIHSFTITAIQRMLGRHNYEALDFVYTNPSSLNVIAVKREKPVATVAIKGFVDTGIEKIIKGLDLKNLWLPMSKRLTWSLHFDDGKQLPLWKKPQGFRQPRSLIIKSDRKVRFPLKVDIPNLFVK